MKKAWVNFSIEHELVFVTCNKNKLYVLDLNQKVTIVDCSFLETATYLNYTDISIHNNNIKAIAENLAKNIQFIYIPLRTIEKRVNPLIKQEYYKSESYTSIQFIKNFIMFFSENFVFMMDIHEFNNSRHLLAFETIGNYFDDFSGIGFNLTNCCAKKVFIKKLGEEKSKTVFLVNEEDSFFYLSENILVYLWQNRNDLSLSSSLIKVKARERNKITADLILSKINREPLKEVTELINDDKFLFFVQKRLKLVYKATLYHFNNFRNTVLNIMCNNIDT